MLGGMSFLYGTSTNLVVSARLDDLGHNPIGLVELTPVGLPAALLGITLVLLLAPVVLPIRKGLGEEDGRARDFITEAYVTRRSRLPGKQLSWLERWLGLSVVAVIRESRRLEPKPELVLEPEDRLVLTGRRRDILRIRHLRGLVLRHDLELRTARRERESVLAEAVVTPDSVLVGSTARDARLEERHGVSLLALHRHPSIQARSESLTPRSLRGVKLYPGDGLLLVGPHERLRMLASDPSFLMLLNIEELATPRHSKAFLAIALFVTALVVGSMGLVPLSVAGVAGVLLMLLTGCLDPKHAFRIDWRVVLLIGAMMALGVAMEKSGAGQLLGSLAAGVADVGGPRLVLLSLMLLTVVLSIPMSNQAAALVVLPIGLSAAASLGVNPRTFAMGIALAASCSFVTPLEPSCMLVFGPGRYRFSDFFRLGGPLTVLMLAVLLVLVPWAWPMETP
jgi:di/tricarboxylate transporter